MKLNLSQVSKWKGKKLLCQLLSVYWYFCFHKCTFLVYAFLNTLSTVNPVQKMTTRLCKTTTRLRRSALSLPKQIPIQSLLNKTTTSLTRPATTFLSPKWKKTCLKQSLLPSKEMGNKNKATMHIKTKRLSDCIYSIATL